MREKPGLYSVYDYETDEMVDDDFHGSCLAIGDEPEVVSTDFPRRLGVLESRHFHFGRGISFASEVLTPKEDLVIYHTAEMPDYILGSFFLNDQFQMSLKTHREKISGDRGGLFWSRTPGEKYTSRLNAERQARSCFIIIDPEFFVSYPSLDLSGPLGMILAGKAEGVEAGGALSAYEIHLLEAISGVDPKSPWDWLRIESLILELIGSSLSRSSGAPGSRTLSGLSARDRARITAARDLLIERKTDPPSLNELARLAGTNEFTLKKGFKILYSDTVYGFLRRFRLKEARDHISSGRFNVTEAALEVGYSNPAAFAAAFKRQYGISPREVRRKPQFPV